MADIKLTARDVERLLTDPSADARVETARKLANQFELDGLSNSERSLAEEIFRLMLHDAEVRVRQALSENLRENPIVPHDIASALARDVDDVAVPFLEISTVLTAEDLIEIVRASAPEKQKAVARRSTVDAQVAEALVESGDVEVAAVLAANKGADISEPTMQRMVDRFGDDERVQGPLIDRERLPVTVSERLVHQVSERLREIILERHELSADVAADLVMHSRERATIGLSSASSEDEVERLVQHMRDHNRLTPSIILRAAVMGDMKFMEYAVAELAGVPVINTRVLIHDSGQLGLKGICEKAGLPRKVFPALRAAVDVAAETDYDGGENDRERYQRRMLERVLTQYGDLGVEFEGGDLEYLLSKMNQLPASYGSEA